jgi:chromosomal replication initiation ATPase DnaA
MWLARRCTGLTLCEIGEAVAGYDYAAVAMAVRRRQARLARDQALRNAAQQAARKLNVKMSGL